VRTGGFVRGYELAVELITLFRPADEQ
jgi:hypothetical protein